MLELYKKNLKTMKIVVKEVGTNDNNEVIVSKTDHNHSACPVEVKAIKS